MESTLTLKKADYESEVGDFMGWGRGELFGETAWSDADQSRIERDVASGLRRFYFCGYDWSFLKPLATLTLLDGFNTITMPDDFGGVEGVIYLTDSAGGYWMPMEFDNPGRVLQLYSGNEDNSGRPICASLRPVKNIPTGKTQRQELFVYPIADADYTFKFTYYIIPDYLTDARNPYAYGGAEHHETILEACLAVAEERRDNAKGVHNMSFERLIRVSMDLDRRKKQQRGGYNRDESDCHERVLDLRGLGNATLTYNGITYD